jgi:hypothetical protein
VIMAVQDYEGSAGRSSHQFVLRLWLEELGNEQYELRGSVHHVSSGEMRYFRDWATLETFTEGLLYRTDGENIDSGTGKET